ncbi:22189_t:CDS:1, partial [Racocetra persica]
YNMKDGMKSHASVFTIYRKAKILMNPALRQQSREAQNEYFKSIIENSDLVQKEKDYAYVLLNKELDNRNVLEGV